MDKGARTYEIETLEYEEPRHVFEMWRWINLKLAEMRESDHFDTIYWERKGRNVKKLIEEAIPVARLALSFVRPAADVFVRCFAGNQPYDAKLAVKGFNNLDIEVEVTTAEPEDALLRRQALSRNGFVYGSGPIERDKADRRKIKSSAVMSDVDEEQQQWIELALNAVVRKIDSGSYGSKTAVLVRMNPCFRWEMRYRVELDRRTRGLIPGHANKVYGVYYYCENGNLLDGNRFVL